MDELLTDLKEGDYPSSSWYNLGLKLGLYDTTLSNIESDYSKVEDRLRKCLVKWLERVDGVDIKGGPSWTTLVKALENCNKKSTAEHIISKYNNMRIVCMMAQLLLLGCKRHRLMMMNCIH